MNRRHFLGSLAALSAGMALDPERLLWVPGRKTYFDIVRPDLKVPDSPWGHIVWHPEAPEWANLLDYRYNMRWAPNPRREALENGHVTIAVNVADWVLVS